MNERFCDLDQEKKETCKVAEEPSEEAWVYCDVCHRAMHQGDCAVNEGGIGLRCAYPDCDLGGDSSHKNLHDWDIYRKARPRETATWPTDPVLATRYV